jgi:single-strand DNA-binding protein
MIGKVDSGYIASGSLSRDPEMKTTKTGKLVTEFSLIAGKKPDGTTRFVNCKAWNDLAQAAASLRKHDSVMVAGRLDSREYNGKTYSDLVCDWIGQSIGGCSPATHGGAPTAQPAEPTFTELADESELPF